MFRARTTGRVGAACSRVSRGGTTQPWEGSMGKQNMHQETEAATTQFTAIDDATVSGVVSVLGVGP